MPRICKTVSLVASVECHVAGGITEGGHRVLGKETAGLEASRSKDSCKGSGKAFPGPATPGWAQAGLYR